MNYRHVPMVGDTDMKGADHLEMTSGALRDTAVPAAVTDIGMLFVPSINGGSHVPEEETKLDDIVLAAEVLEEALMLLSADS